MYNFEKLNVWKESVSLAEVVYVLCKQLPKEEKYALADQLKRAVTSICLNIAEGSGGRNKKIFASYLENAIRSLYETVAALKLAERLFGISVKRPLEQCDKVGKLLHGLLKNIRSEN